MEAVMLLGHSKSNYYRGCSSRSSPRLKKMCSTLRLETNERNSSYVIEIDHYVQYIKKWSLSLINDGPTNLPSACRLRRCPLATRPPHGPAYGLEAKRQKGKPTNLSQQTNFVDAIPTLILLLYCS